jgi:hypothetical protein
MERRGRLIPVILHEPDDEVSQKRIAEYPTMDEMIIALWEGVVEERMAAVTKLEGKRQAVKTKYPK